MPATEQIIGHVLSGHTEAFAELVRLYQREVWAVVSAMLLDRTKTEDLVQQTFVNAYQRLDRFERERDFGAWIKEIARNQVRQELRSRQREGHRLELYHRHLSTQMEDPPVLEGQKRLADALVECIQKLPTAAAEMIQMRYEDAMDFGRIAAQLGRTVEATRQHLARIRITLRDCIRKRLAQP
jgi:RNA polymerase sigma-70 factor (ECF subfamily)